MPKESGFIVVRRKGSKAEFVMHAGHDHFWTQDFTQAMFYTRRDVAEGIANKMGGVVEPSTQ